MRRLAVLAAALLVGLGTAGCLAPGDPGPGFASSGTFPNPGGIYYHVQVGASATPYYWHVWNAAQDVYNLTGIALYVDPPGTAPTAGPGKFKVRMAAGVEANYCGTAGWACGQTETSGNRITGGTMLLVPGAINNNAAGSIHHELGHLLGLAHYLAGDTLMNPSISTTETTYDAGTILGLAYQRDQGCAVWGVSPCPRGAV